MSIKITNVKLEGRPLSAPEDKNNTVVFTNCELNAVDFRELSNVPLEFHNCKVNDCNFSHMMVDMVAEESEFNRCNFQETHISRISSNESIFDSNHMEGMKNALTGRGMRFDKSYLENNYFNGYTTFNAYFNDTEVVSIKGRPGYISVHGSKSGIVKDALEGIADTKKVDNSLITLDNISVVKMYMESKGVKPEAYYKMTERETRNLINDMVKFAKDNPDKMTFDGKKLGMKTREVNILTNKDNEHVRGSRSI